LRFLKIERLDETADIRLNCMTKIEKKQLENNKQEIKWSLSAALDSLKVRIPLEQVQILDGDLREYFYLVEVNADTGEILDIDEIKETQEFRRKAFHVEQQGIKTSYRIQALATSKAKTGAEFLVVLLNAKLLRGRYNEGITHSNINIIHKAILKHKKVVFSLSSLLNAVCTDVDIKKDTLLCGSIEEAKADFGVFIDHFKSLTLAKKEKRNGVRSFQTKENLGIQWSERAEATLGCPYVKFYFKILELVNRSSEFYEQVLQKQVPHNLIRHEVAIKNKKHWCSLTKDTTEMTLHKLLALKPCELNKILRQTLEKHIDMKQLDYTEKERKEEKYLADVFCLAYLDFCKSKCIAKGRVAKYTNGKMQLSRARAKIEEYWDKEFEGTRKHATGENLDKILGYLKIGEEDCECCKEIGNSDNYTKNENENSKTLKPYS